MSDAQKRLAYILMTTISGPLIAVLASSFHWSSSDVQLWLNLFSALTVALGAAWGITSFSPASQAKDVSHMDGVQLHVDKTEAAPSITALADSHDPTLKDIVPMTGLTGTGPAVPVEKK